MGLAGLTKIETDERKPNAVPCEVYDRVVGYYRPVSNWNHGKKVEFGQRRRYDKAITSTGLAPLARKEK